MENIGGGMAVLMIQSPFYKTNSVDICPGESGLKISFNELQGNKIRQLAN